MKTSDSTRSSEYPFEQVRNTYSFDMVDFGLYGLYHNQ